MRKIDGKFRRTRVAAGLFVLACSLRASSASAQPAPTSEPSSTRSPRKSSLDPFIIAGGAARIDDAPLFNITERFGGNFGIGFAYQFHPTSIGLSYEYTGLGREDSGIGPFGFVRLDRSLDTIWASFKVRLSGPTWAVPFFGVGLGATWQDLHVKGIVLPDRGILPGRAFRCSATDSVNLAMRVGGGFEFPIGSAVSFVTEVSFDAYRLSSDIVDFCAPGAGATSALLARAGLVFRYDLSEGKR